LHGPKRSGDHRAALPRGAQSDER